MTSEFITRVEHEKEEPYTVIFKTDDADKYKQIEDECRKMIGHAQPTVDAVPVVRCGRCEYYSNEMNCCSYVNGLQNVTKTDYCSYGRCADGERRSE